MVTEVTRVKQKFSARAIHQDRKPKMRHKPRTVKFRPHLGNSQVTQFSTFHLTLEFLAYNSWKAESSPNI